MIGGKTAAIVILAVTAAACSQGNQPGARQALPGSTRQPALAASPVRVQSGLAAPGTLTVAADPTEAPLVYFDRTNRFAGFSIELAGEIASQLGLRLHVLNIDGGQIIPGFADPQHRYDMGVAAQPATDQLSSSASTLEYLVGGQVILARSDDHKTQGLSGLCGLKVGANRGSAGEAIVLRANEAGCQSQPIVYAAYSDDVKGVHDLQSGTVKAYVQDFAVATAFARLYPDVRVVPRHLSTAPEVFLFALTNVPLRDAAAQAFERVRRSGDYRKLLDRWGLREGAVS